MSDDEVTVQELPREMTEADYLAWIEMVPAMLTEALHLPDGLHFEWERTNQ